MTYVIFWRKVMKKLRFSQEINYYSAKSYDYLRDLAKK